MPAIRSVEPSRNRLARELAFLLVAFLIAAGVMAALL